MHQSELRVPIFISYSHSDRDFVEELATQLVVHKVNVWLDRWEMHVGESLIDRIQSAITDARVRCSLSCPKSVAGWYKKKKELNNGLIREAGRTPNRRAACSCNRLQYTDFLAGKKLYADFRTDFDDGLTTILEAIAKVTNEWQNRLEEPTWHTDWSIDWFKAENGINVLRLTLVDITQSQPYTVLTTIGMLRRKL